MDSLSVYDCYSFPRLTAVVCFYLTVLTHYHTVPTALPPRERQLKSWSNQEAFISHCLSDGTDPLSSGLVAVVRPDSSRVYVGRGVEQLRAGSRAFLAFLQTPFPSRSAVRKGLCAQWAGLAQDSSHDGANSCWSCFLLLSVSCLSAGPPVCLRLELGSSYSRFNAPKQGMRSIMRIYDLT